MVLIPMTKEYMDKKNEATEEATTETNEVELTYSNDEYYPDGYTIKQIGMVLMVKNNSKRIP